MHSDCTHVHLINTTKTTWSLREKHGHPLWQWESNEEKTKKKNESRQCLWFFLSHSYSYPLYLLSTILTWYRWSYTSPRHIHMTVLRLYWFSDLCSWICVFIDYLVQGRLLLRRQIADVTAHVEEPLKATAAHTRRQRPAGPLIGGYGARFDRWWSTFQWSPISFGQQRANSPISTQTSGKCTFEIACNQIWQVVASWHRYLVIAALFFCWTSLQTRNTSRHTYGFGMGYCVKM